VIFFVTKKNHFSSTSSNQNHRSHNHRTVRQLSKKNLERQNTLYDEEQFEQPLDTCSEINYNMNYRNDECYDSYAYNQQWQNGESNHDPYGYSNNKKTLPQPPMSYSQSVNDGFGARFVNLNYFLKNQLSIFLIEGLAFQQHLFLSNVTIVNYPSTHLQLTNHKTVVFQSLHANYLHQSSLLLQHSPHSSEWERTPRKLAKLKLKEDHCFLFYLRVNHKLRNRKII
jgi:hypothetical protein